MTTTTTVVHRITIPFADETLVRVPGFVRALHAAPARPHIDPTEMSIELWYLAIADIDEVMDVRIRIAGTGHPFTFRADHLASFPTNDGRFVWHVFVEYPLEEKLQ